MRDERYEVLGELATGGMATVYLARLRRPLGFSRLVAIKSMHPQYAKDPAFATMFVDEARLTARLRHPNIVPTLDIVEGGGQLQLVMEYVEGDSLAALLRAVRDAKQRVPVPIACAIVHDVLLGLHQAHEAVDDDGAPLAIIHRDVSPQNVMVGLDGLARVLDFGVAKARSRAHHSNSGEIKGKIPYMPPEQLFGEPLDRRVDVYAAGILLWETLTASRLFDGATEEILVHRIGEGRVDPPSARAPEVPAALDALVLRALSREREDRFATALAMAEQLASLVPLPTRTEVSAWVTRFARTPPVVPSSSSLADDLATRHEVRHETPSEIPVFTERASIAPRAGVAPGRVALTIAAGLAAVAVTIGGAAAASYATAAARPRVVAARTADETRSPLAAGAVRTRVAPAVALSARPARAVTAPPAEPVDAAPQRCRLPYVFDAEGRRHYKVECL